MLKRVINKLDVTVNSPQLYVCNAYSFLVCVCRWTLIFNLIKAVNVKNVFSQQLLKSSYFSAIS